MNGQNDSLKQSDRVKQTDRSQHEVIQNQRKRYYGMRSPPFPTHPRQNKHKQNMEKTKKKKMQYGKRHHP
jgi:hypothetical protein